MFDYKSEPQDFNMLFEFLLHRKVKGIIHKVAEEYARATRQ